MSRATQHWSLGRRFALRIAVVVVMGGVLCFTVLGHSYINLATHRARQLSLWAEDLGSWSSTKSVWLRVRDAGQPRADSLESIPLVIESTGISAKPDAQKGILVGSFQRQDHSLVLREVSRISQARGVQVRLTSSQPMNPDNAPNRFELAALDSFKQPGVTEFVSIQGANLQFARRLTATPDCLICHDYVEKAPAEVRAKFPNSRGFGFRTGEMAGAVSVIVPIFGAEAMPSFGMAAWLSVALFACSLIWLVQFVRRSMIKPVERLSAYAHRVSKCDIADLNPAELRFDTGEVASSPEVAQLHIAVKRLLRGLHINHYMKEKQL